MKGKESELRWSVVNVLEYLYFPISVIYYNRLIDGDVTDGIRLNF